MPEGEASQQIAITVAREHIRPPVYGKRNDDRSDVFSYIEMFDNPMQRHGTDGDTSRAEFERRHAQRLVGVSAPPTCRVFLGEEASLVRRHRLGNRALGHNLIEADRPRDGRQVVPVPCEPLSAQSRLRAVDRHRLV